MLRLLCLSLLASGSAFHILRGMNEPGNYQLRLVEYGGMARQRNSLCLPTPFWRQICFPTALHFFIPQRTFITEGQRCLTVPIMTAYVVKVCPGKETSERIWKEVREEGKTETEVASDKTQSEFNGRKAAEENAEEEESVRETEESKLKDESKRNLIRISVESGDDDSENDSIMSNFV